MTARDSFVARFGEDQAAAIEQAAQKHYAEDHFTVATFSTVGSVHGGDNFGSEPFRYWFLLAIGRECVTRFRDRHGITADVDAMKEWARGEGRLGEHDGDVPDYLAILVGAYDEWVDDAQGAGDG